MPVLLLVLGLAARRPAAHGRRDRGVRARVLARRGLSRLEGALLVGAYAVHLTWVVASPT